MTDALILTILMVLAGILTMPFWAVWASKFYDFLMGYSKKDKK